MTRKAIILAHYLPQFHPIEENDKWWGKGFTEWTNTVKAKPLFRGHLQPNLPSDLGFYDLRIPEVREEQAKLAECNGITGFAYWHYWFGNGKRILERPFNEVFQTGKPDFPFCLAWANESWTGIWHGLKDKVLIEQIYPGDYDLIDHFNEILPALKDYRYIKIDNKPIFIVYQPDLLPDKIQFTKLWNTLAIQNGFDGMYLIGISNLDWDYKKDGFDSKSVHPLYLYISMFDKKILNRLKNKITNLTLGIKNKSYRYKDLVNYYDQSWLYDYDFIPTLLPNWDNTPRSGKKGVIIRDSSPELFYNHFRSVASQLIKQKTNPNNIILIKSWNEWAEGNYIEPDSRWGLGYLHAIRDVIKELHLDSKYLP